MLYEVITRQRHDRAGRESRPDQGRRIRDQGYRKPVGHRTRITSYNVCYTKLLRDNFV